MKNRAALTLLAGALLISPALARPSSSRPDEVTARPDYYQVVHDTAAMVSNVEVQKIAASHGLQVLNLTWEDTGRYKNSCVGPNISDVTLQIQTQNPQNQRPELVCLPVIRFPNFQDKTSDLQMDHFFLLVGNQKGRDLRKVSLREYLGNFREFLSSPDSWKGHRRSLLADRDSHVLVSAQACFLPIPKGGAATFNPVLFNYQSGQANPAVLSIVATREGTSATIIDNQRDAFAAGPTWGQRLFFNHSGERASFTGQRMSEFTALTPTVSADDSGKPIANPERNAGLNMVLLIQVPLKQKFVARRGMMSGVDCVACPPATTVRRESDVEAAVVGHGKIEGPYTEVDNLAIERDTKFPVRVTVQFYKATSNGAVDEKDLAQIAAQLNQVYADGDYVGSLVTGGATQRPTEHAGEKIEPADWWVQFWTRYHQQNQQTAPSPTSLLYRFFASVLG